MLKKVFETTDLKNPFQVEIGTYARNVDASVLVRFKDTVVLSATVFSDKKNNFDFLPLTVIYQEKFYAAGKIPGSFLRREGRSTDHEILASRLIDRSLRPLFPENFKQEIQVINTVLSSDPDFKSEIASILGSSLSLLISEIPFFEAVAGAYVARIQDQFILNPTFEQLNHSSLHLLVTGTKSNVVMIEAHANEVSEEIFLEAIEFGHQHIKILCLFQEQIQKEIGKTKKKVNHDSFDLTLETSFNEQYRTKIIEAILHLADQPKSNYLQLLKEQIFEQASKKNFFKTIEENTFIDLEAKKNYLQTIEILFQKLFKQEIRNLIIQDKKRPDKRGLEEIRNLESQIDLLPRTHGSALFTRGQTQSLAVVTLGSVSESKIIDGLNDEQNKRFMLHYNFPPFAVGAVGRYIAPSRREIGHGNLGEKAIVPLLPEENDFPYTIRVVSEILESNGSSSQASICATSMALMAAGVPLKKAVSGIAMGLFMDSETKEYVILSDIQGLEDHIGDMDLKIAGSKDGITALQMDLKIQGVSQEILKQTFLQAKKGRLYILEHMNKVIDTPRQEMSKYAPKVQMIQIKPEKIRDIIGSGGKIINQIIEAHDGVKIDIEQDGRVFVMHSNADIIKQTIAFIKGLSQEIAVGNRYQAQILRFLTDRYGKTLGAVGRVFQGIEGLIRAPQTQKITDIVKIGDQVSVKCVKINERGRIDFILLL
ncbi:polyribonucleotide nucleotidyltransferase [Candidatus Phytoplasma solani]|uniref:Polyribonucleotide nucleotidyltransferase n=2 Tax=Candidatus Phytoplasma solani TaxID=69896 RepID=A0A421NYW9_9MOLU|nr:polyribonucleotide nucleotidyltransferase [Candidatus Phytoplasma solani]RMI89140.1 polynucleotide phosphorylase/polyadenylase [Candidatus Phytoplasma solani]CCP88393.1 Polyribonucleotide nucleotidyltransferase [Candidatus Phytoplasma solani]